MTTEAAWRTWRSSTDKHATARPSRCRSTMRRRSTVGAGGAAGACFLPLCGLRSSVCCGAGAGGCARMLATSGSMNAGSYSRAADVSPLSAPTPRVPARAAPRTASNQGGSAERGTAAEGADAASVPAALVGSGVPSAAGAVSRPTARTGRWRMVCSTRPAFTWARGSTSAAAAAPAASASSRLPSRAEPNSVAACRIGRPLCSARSSRRSSAWSAWLIVPP